MQCACIYFPRGRALIQKDAGNNARSQETTLPVPTPVLEASGNNATAYSTHLHNYAREREESIAKRVGEAMPSHSSSSTLPEMPSLLSSVVGSYCGFMQISVLWPRSPVLHTRAHALAQKHLMSHDAPHSTTPIRWRTHFVLQLLQPHRTKYTIHSQTEWAKEKGQDKFDFCIY